MSTIELLSDAEIVNRRLIGLEEDFDNLLNSVLEDHDNKYALTEVYDEDELETVEDDIGLEGVVGVVKIAIKAAWHILNLIVVMLEGFIRAVAGAIGYIAKKVFSLGKSDAQFDAGWDKIKDKFEAWKDKGSRIMDVATEASNVSGIQVKTPLSNHYAAGDVVKGSELYKDTKDVIDDVLVALPDIIKSSDVIDSYISKLYSYAKAGARGTAQDRDYRELSILLTDIKVHDRSSISSNLRRVVGESTYDLMHTSQEVGVTVKASTNAVSVFKVHADMLSLIRYRKKLLKVLNKEIKTLNKVSDKRIKSLKKISKIVSKSPNEVIANKVSKVASAIHKYIAFHNAETLKLIRLANKIDSSAHGIISNVTRYYDTTEPEEILA